MNSNAFIARLCHEVPMMTSGALAALLQRSGFAEVGLIEPDAQRAAEHPFLRRLRENMRPTASLMPDGIAVVPVEGVLAYKPDPFEMLYGVEDSGEVLSLIEAVGAEPSVKGILLDVNSPGGFVVGGPEIGDAVRRIDRNKPVVTWSGGMACSLAYWVGSQAGEFIASRSAIIGSVGVFSAHIDQTEFLKSLGIKVEIFRNKEGTYKAAGAYGTSLTDDQRQNIQSDVQATFREFRKAVKSARPQIEDDSLQGQTYSGSDARAHGLIDRVGDKPFALSVLRRAVRARAA